MLKFKENQIRKTMTLAKLKMDTINDTFKKYNKVKQPHDEKEIDKLISDMIKDISDMFDETYWNII